MARAHSHAHPAPFGIHWHRPSARTIGRYAKGALLLGLLVLLWAAGAWFAHSLAQSLTIDGTGFVQALPLNALATAMAISWMPLFLPFIIPLVATAWVVIWAIAAISELGDPD